MTVAFPYVGSRFADPHRSVRRCAVRGHRHLCRGEEEGPAVNFGIGTVVRARGRCARRSGRYCFRGLWDRSSAPMSCGHPQVFFRAAGTRYQHIPNTRLLPLLGSVPPSASQTEGGGGRVFRSADIRTVFCRSPAERAPSCCEGFRIRPRCMSICRLPYPAESFPSEFSDRG